MQIDFSDKRAIAGIVAAVIIVLQMLILWGRPTQVVYQPVERPLNGTGNTGLAKAPGHLSAAQQKQLDAIADEMLNKPQEPFTQDDLDELDRLSKKALGPRGGRCGAGGRWDGQRCQFDALEPK